MRKIVYIFVFLYLTFEIFGQKRFVPNQSQISPHHCWAASIVMCINQQYPNEIVNQDSLIYKINQNCDLKNCKRCINNQICFFDNKPTCSQCQKRLDANSKLADEVMEANLKTIDSLLSIYNLSTESLYIDLKSMDKNIEIKNRLVNEIEKGNSIIAIDEMGSLHVTFIYDYKIKNEQTYFYINDPYPVQHKTEKTKKKYWKSYQALVHFPNNLDLDYKNVKFRKSKFKREYYKLMAFRIVSKK